MPIRIRARLLALAALAASPAVAPAQAPSLQLTTATAEAIVAGCKRHAQARGQAQGVAVVDAGGAMVAALRMDGVVPGAMAFAIDKARAASAWGWTTDQMGKMGGGGSGFDRAPSVVTMAGGVPLYSADGKTLLGAAGASGQVPVDDVACVEAGIAAAGLRSVRAPR
jgi:glc operon protein GlcG